MSEIKNTQESETDQEKNTEQSSDQLKYYIAENGKPLIAIDDRVLVTILKALLTGHAVNPFDPVLFENIFMNLKNVLIDVKTLTPQTLALVFTALTELTTKLWLIAKHRFVDLIEYTQTHDVRFANEAGSTITYVTYNSPFSFGLQVDRLVPGISEAIMTIVDGLSQRKAKRERLEIDNQITLNAVKVAGEQLKQQPEMSELEREKQEISLEKQRLNNEKIKQVLVEQRLELQMKQIEQALELAAKAVDIVYPNADPEMRPILLQTLVNNILQLDKVEGLRLTISGTGIQKYLQSEGIEQ